MFDFSGRTEQRRLILTGESTRVEPKAARERASAPKISLALYCFIITSSFLMGSTLRRRRGLHLQPEFFGRGAAGANPPPVHAKGAGQGHERLLLFRGRGARAGQVLAPFFDAAIVGLMAQEPPRALAQGPAQSRVARLGDVALVLARPRTVFARTQSQVAGDLSAVLEAGPVAGFALQNLCGERAQSFGQRCGRTFFNDRILRAQLVVEKETRGAQRFQQCDEPFHRAEGPDMETITGIAAKHGIEFV